MKCEKCLKEKTGRFKKGLCHSCYNSQWAKGKPQVKARMRAYYEQHQDVIKARSRAWEVANPEKKRENSRLFKKLNPEKRALCESRRRNGIKVRTPFWADTQKIKKFYRQRPEGMTVDHIIPLSGKEVSGLHVHYNLQYLTPEQNVAKANKLVGAQ